MPIPFKSFALSTALICLALTATAEIRLGVIAPSGELKAQKRWAPLAVHLSTVLGEEVTLMPMVVTQGFEKIAAGEIDVMIGTPVQAAMAKHSFGARMIASMIKKSGSEFAGVIIANPNSGIHPAADLRGKKVMTMPVRGAGGYLFQAGHLRDVGVNAPDEFGMHAIGKNQEDIVKLIARGVFDAGFVRSGIIERLIASGEIDAAQVIVVDARSTPGFDLQHTTRLYPEWFAFALESFDADTAALVRQALIDLEAGHPAVAAAKINGFETPHGLAAMDALRGSLPRALRCSLLLGQGRC